MEEKPEVNYQSIAPDPEKSCGKCQNFTPTEDGKGDCFGHEVVAQGTCNFYTDKE